MDRRSHINEEKIARLNIGQSFEYRDVVQDDFPFSQHSEDGALFKREVESGIYDNIVVSDPGASHVKYKRI